jgi:hypothetical protein
MTTDFLLFCIVVTLVTFAVICVFAIANPVYPKRSYDAGNWGNYGKNNNKVAKCAAISGSISRTGATEPFPPE